MLDLRSKFLQGASILSCCIPQTLSMQQRAHALDISIVLNSPHPQLPREATSIPEHTTALKSTAFYPMKGVARNLGNLLGFDQLSEIIKHTKQGDIPDNIDPHMPYNQLDSISFPLIAPGLTSFFPQELEDLFLQPSFDRYAQAADKHFLIASQCSDGRCALAYYKEWKLTMATRISPGLGKQKTYLEGCYPLIRNPQENRKQRRSNKYFNSPMPYAIQIKDGYFLHQGESNGKPLSKGCLRLPWLYQKWLYEQLEELYKSGTKPPVLVIHGLYTPSLATLDSQQHSSADTKQLE